MSNPLLADQALPPFSSIRAEHVAPALDVLIGDFEATVDRVCDDGVPISYQAFVAPQQACARALADGFAPISQLHAVTDDEELQAAYADGTARISALMTKLSQDQRRYRRFSALKNDTKQWNTLTQAQRQVIDNELRDFRLQGVALPAAKREAFSAISVRLTELATQFEQNLVKATDAWRAHFDHEAALAGLPEYALAAARQAAAEQDLPGFLITLQVPSYQAVITYADDRELRQRVYRAFATRASDQSSIDTEDNAPIIAELVAKRAQLAAIVGFESFVDYSLARKMADNAQQVASFLQDLASRARPGAEADKAELIAFAAQQGIEDVQAWDIAYLAEKLREQKFGIDDNALRPYFPLPQVVDGLLMVAKKVFGVADIVRREDVPRWHDSVQFFELRDATGKAIAGCYADFYARSGKRGGAWMDVCREPDVARDRVPVAYLNCNFTPPTASRPSLLSHREVETLFHEFGHALHHMLTEVSESAVCGISGVEWDAVELPSQMLENWCWQREALDLFARHVDTGETLPGALFEKMLAARHFHAGLFLLRQLEFALFDLRLHRDGGDTMAVLEAVRQEISVWQPPAWNRFPNGFSHIFGGGYAAGYYSYLWAEQLAADAFSAFEETSVFDTQVGQRFRAEVLAVGGSRPAMQNFVAFRGREPIVEPLLKSYGLAA